MARFLRDVLQMRFLLVLCSLLVPLAASAQSGVRFTPDGKQALISKDVGGERWAISYDFATDTVTGNVFFPAGGEPLFVWCERAGERVGLNPIEDVILACFGNDRCELDRVCGTGWTFIADVTLPGAFFLEPTVAPTRSPAPVPTLSPTPRPTVTPSPRPTVRPTPRPTPRPTNRPSCCRVCTTGKACGDSCISRSDTCRRGPGCACNG
jgi:hypothetical protein